MRNSPLKTLTIMVNALLIVLQFSKEDLVVVCVCSFMSGIGKMEERARIQHKLIMQCQTFFFVL